MNLSHKLPLIALFIGLFSNGLFGAGTLVSNAKILKIHVIPKSNTVYLFINKSFDGQKCNLSPSVTTVVQLNPKYPGFREQYALALNAFSTGKQIQLDIEGCGLSGYPEGQNLEVGF